MVFFQQACCGRGPQGAVRRLADGCSFKIPAGLVIEKLLFLSIVLNKGKPRNEPKIACSIHFYSGYLGIAAGGEKTETFRSCIVLVQTVFGACPQYAVPVFI